MARRIISKAGWPNTPGVAATRTKSSTASLALLASTPKGHSTCSRTFQALASSRRSSALDFWSKKKWRLFLASPSARMIICESVMRRAWRILRKDWTESRSLRNRCKCGALGTARPACLPLIAFDAELFHQLVKCGPAHAEVGRCCADVAAILAKCLLDHFPLHRLSCFFECAGRLLARG